MGENNNIGHQPESARRRDGNIDFSRYATEQLQELRDSLDPAANPLNHAALLVELEKRASAEPGCPRWTGRFTRLSGLAGWISARFRRSPFYGEGSLELQDDQLVLQGRERTSLGIGVERALVVPLQDIRNVKETPSGVRFEIRRKRWLSRKVVFSTTNASHREEIVRALPDTRTVRFEKYGSSLLTFEEQLRSRCPVAWVTPALVLLNVAVFCALWIQAGSITASLGTPLALLGINVGPLTLDGQWWRLLTALFIHADAWHLLLNLWALWSIGRLSERLYGRWSFLLIYLCGGLFASLSSLLWDPARSSIGASGAIFAVFGAFLACLLRQRAVIPRGIFRSHWIPTLLFLGFNLVNGALTPGIDNAAHVGGLLFGVAAGLLLARPAETRTESGLRLRWTEALVLFVLWAGGALGFALWTRGPTPVGQQFVAHHAWYVTGEARSMAAWRQLSGASAAGTISDEDLGRRFGNQVRPFWQEAVPKLEAEVPGLSGEEQRYVGAIARFARLRLEWADAVVAATSGRDLTQLDIARAKDEEAMGEIAHIEWLNARSNAERMTGGLVNLAPIQKLRSWLAMKRDRCVEAPPAFRTGVPVGDKDLETDTPRLMQKIGCEAQEHFLGGDFRTLDEMFSEAAGRTGDLPGGASTLNALLGGVSDLMYYSESGNVEDYLRQFALWRRAVPDSYYPDLLEVELFQNWAWAARGHGTSTQITQQAWGQFIHRTRIAQAALDDSPEAARQNPLWCHLAMRAQHDQGNDLKPIEELFDACVTRFPEYTSLYRNMLRSLMPRWYGAPGQATEFIERMANALPFGQRDAMYASLFWIYADLEGDSMNIFRDAGADWIWMNHGFHDLREKYPESDYVLNVSARFACLADDEENYRALARLMWGRRSASAWTRETTRAGCDRRL